ncbi:hypothetical protein REH65_31255 [Saccharopolyspora sp. ID03-671]|uniref:hypothetical protein n=1 Tax=Saccharopolyspora sp. ID03-671 TaxID=3073066 RepID=UPI00324FCAF5
MSTTGTDQTTPATAPAVTEQYTAEPDAYPYVLRGVDPRELRADGNSRNIGDIRKRRPELVASVAEHGVNPMISIINVAPDFATGVLDVLVGFNRHAAAVEVKGVENPDLTIDVLVHAPGTTRQDILVAQGIENIHREGYTQTEEAALYEQLALTGLGDDAIAQTLTRPVERVRAGRKVAATSRTRAAGATVPNADLLVLAQLSEFADDEDEHQELVDVLNRRPHDFEWKLGQLRRRRDQRAKQAEEEQRLVEQGYTLFDNAYDLPEGTARLAELCTGDDETPLDPAEHRDCPGRAAVVDVDPELTVRVTELCNGYAGHGHRTIDSVRVAAEEDHLRAKGVPVVDPETEGLVQLRELFADETAERPLTVDEHASCPGHAAYTDIRWSSVDVTYVCTDYAAHGHILRTSPSTQREPDPAIKAAERKRAAANNKLWREAKTDRREWLAKYFSGWRKRKTADLPARVHHWLALAPVLASDYLEEAAPANRYACTLLKLGEPEGYRRENNPLVVHLRKRATTEPQAVLIRLAQVIGACEQHWDRAYTESADASWRQPTDSARYYFELLDALGYPLSHVEQLVNNPELDNEHWAHLAADDQDDDGDGDDSDDGDDDGGDPQMA